VTKRGFAASKNKERTSSMQQQQGSAEVQGDVQPRRRWWRRLWFRSVAGILLVGVIACGVAAEYLLHNAEPILRKRVVETLSKRFNAPVELDSLHISLLKGIEVSGGGLRVPYSGPADPNAPGQTHIILSVDHFAFRSDFKSLWHSPMRIMTVYVDNMTIDLPVGVRGEALLGPNQKAGESNKQPKLAIVVDEIRCRNTKLILETNNPQKAPKVFAIQALVLKDVGSAKPFTYEAHLINPIPKGQIDSTGHFGPWNSELPRQTPLDGDFTFTQADLNTIKGLSGTLSSVGHFSGVLERLNVDGTADVPDFSLDISDHPVPLHTQYHAFVDATNGDTTLDPVHATMSHSAFTCRGVVSHIKGKGHDIALAVEMPHGRMEDLLRLGMKSEPPMMNGGVTMKANLHIPPGKVRVASKIELAGTIHISAVHFTNAKLQDRIDGLSMRAQGKPNDVKAAASDGRAEVASQMDAHFSLAHELMTVPSVDYQFPGATVTLHGVYSLPGSEFEFKGHVRTEATASQMTTGWKSMLLKAVDPLLRKNGAGVELPISISGTKSDLKFGLAFKDSDETTAQMANDLKPHNQPHAVAPPQ
jgi:hypothetical protein